jgi:transposase
MNIERRKRGSKSGRIRLSFQLDSQDDLFEKNLSLIFLKIALAVVKTYQILTNFSHLDSSSFSVHGKYLDKNLMTDKKQENGEAEPAPITITKGYSRDHRPDLKQFIIDLKEAHQQKNIN